MKWSPSVCLLRVLSCYIDNVQLGEFAQLSDGSVRRLIGHSDGQVAHVLTAKHIHPRTALHAASSSRNHRTLDKGGCEAKEGQRRLDDRQTRKGVWSVEGTIAAYDVAAVRSSRKRGLGRRGENEL